jgi:hypothetical protein
MDTSRAPGTVLDASRANSLHTFADKISAKIVHKRGPALSVCDHRAQVGY